MKSRKVWVIITCLFVLVLSLSAEGQRGGSSVEDIYNSIRYSTPQYQWEERIVNFSNEGMNLVCTLTVPKTQQPRPIILVLHGFLGDRKGVPITGTSELFWDPLARVLAGHGFCCLRVDFRGSGESEGTFDITTFTGQLSDALAALDFIQTLDKPVNSARIGVVGHSQGGLVASLTAAADKRVESTVLWAATAFPAHDFEGFLLKDGIKAGLALPDGGIITLPIYLEGVYLGDVTLGKQFFVELFSVDPLAAIRTYKRPLMYISPTQDVVVWPQPLVGQAFLNYHDGEEKLVTLEAGHNYYYYIGPDRIEDASYWTTAWFIKTMNKKN